MTTNRPLPSSAERAPGRDKKNKTAGNGARACPAVSFIGKSNVGKTTLIEKLIPIFNSAGLKVGTIKHSFHGFEFDREGKDSWRHRRAGAAQTVISTPGTLALVRSTPGDTPVENILGFFEGFDLVITDGFKTDKFPKIEVFRPSHYAVPMLGEGDSIIAYATDAPEFAFPVSVPVLDINDPAMVAGFVAKYFKLKIDF